MSALTFTDRFWRAMARGLDRQVLSLVASQKLVRAAFAVTGPLGSALPRGARVEREEDGSQWITPQGVARDTDTLLYFHGGGFTIGSPRTHAALVGHLAAAAGMRAYIPRYRLAPEHPFPAAKDDACAAFDKLVAAGLPPAALCGDSAGGCLALQVALHARDQGAPMPKAMGLIAPIADFADDIEARFADSPDEMLIPAAWAKRILSAYLPEHDPASPDISPLKGDLSGLPPALIQAGAEEALAQDAEALARAMPDVTLDLWPGVPHVWHIHAGRAPAADRALAQMGAYLRDKAGTG